MYAYYHDNLKNQIGGEGDYNNNSNEEKENHALPLFCKNCIIHSPFHLFKQTIMHLVYLLNLCLAIVSNLPWVLPIKITINS